MPIDILIFAAIAAFLVYRLNAVLGTRHGDEKRRQNPFSAAPREPMMPETVRNPAPVSGPVLDLRARPAPAPADLGALIDPAANKDGRVETGLLEISAADAAFDARGFVDGARMAFEMIVTSYNKGDLAALKNLLSPKLFKDFEAGVKAREADGRTAEVIIHRITAARIVEAHLGGVMAYVTVDFDVEETAVTRDREGKVVEGDPDRIFTVEDIWTFTRDIRSRDPNWTLIETRSVEK